MEKIITWVICLIVLLPSAIIDQKHKIIPNPLSLGGAAAILLIRFIFLRSQSPFIFLLSGIYAGAVFFLIERISHGKMGFGDVKLSLFIGLCLGFWGWHISVFTASLFGIMMYFLRKNKSEKQIAFAPFLCCGSFAALLLITFDVVPMPV